MPPQEPRKWEAFGFDKSSQHRHRQTNTFLDNIPVRNSLKTPQIAEESPLAAEAKPPRLQPTNPHGSLWAPSDDESYSPTASEFDALEESICDYETQSTLAEDTNASQIVSHVSSSASYSHDAGARFIASFPSLSRSVDESEPQMARSLEDRLRLVWRRLFVSYHETISVLVFTYMTDLRLIPLAKTTPELENAPFAVLWELSRVALHCDIDPAELDLQKLLQDTWKEYDVFWTSLRGIPSLRECKFPEKSDPGAWRMCFEPHAGNEAVILTATMHLEKSRSGHLMRLELHPLKREQSSRLFRHFGSDRYLEVRMPSVDSWQCDAPAGNVEAAVAEWLTGAPHEFLGRRWSGFYVRDRQIKVEFPGTSPREEPRPVFYDRVLLFAETGKGLLEPHALPAVVSSSVSSQPPDVQPASAMACSRNAMLDWLLDFQANGNQKYLKLFHRVALGLSKTMPIVVLQHDQIRYHPQDIESPTGEVMNDGAGRISASLMRKVRDALGLQAIPSAIQGRLGSAKGMWVTDVTDLGHEDWIETYPSQRKWKCDASEEAHRILEVRSWSTELVPAGLNIQFLPILEDRALDAEGIRTTFVNNMITESEAEIETLKSALQYPELLRKWIRQSSSAQADFQRLSNRAIPFLGGLPDSQDEVMSFLLDGGFEPMQLKFLQDLVFQRQRQKGEKMKEGLRINIAKSTYAYMLVDFWGVLEPDEVHLCFSRFDDGDGELSDLDGVDVLVARAPAHLPSDIQKVKAVFKPELRHLRDVIIFSAKGDVPLAAMLSGGDYDGDKAWVCWDPEIVNNFENHSLPPQPDFKEYLEKDETTLDDLRKEHGKHHCVDAMIKQAFHFNLKKKFLGEYHVSDEHAIKLSWLLSDLADQPKQGITFGQEAWNRFRDDILGTRREFPPPAYKTGALSSAGRGRNLHIIDFLMGHAKHVVDSALTDLHAFLQSSGASTTDRAVISYWDRFEGSFGAMDSGDFAPRCAWFTALRDGLKADVEACLAKWRDLMSGSGAGVQDYSEKVKRVYETWRAIKPRLPTGGEDNSALLAEVLGRQDDDLVAPDLTRWELLKASWAFKHHHRRRFVWQMAGRQLQHIKALTVAGSVLVAPNIYAALRTDNAYVKRLMARISDGDCVLAGYHDGGAGDNGMGQLPWSSSPAEEDSVEN